MVEFPEQCRFHYPLLDNAPIVLSEPGQRFRQTEEAVILLLTDKKSIDGMSHFCSSLRVSTQFRLYHNLANIRFKFTFSDNALNTSCCVLDDFTTCKPEYPTTL
jgi:hypothetical protein